jgi:low affinity Fe/Cu permease
MKGPLGLRGFSMHPHLEQFGSQALEPKSPPWKIAMPTAKILKATASHSNGANGAENGHHSGSLFADVANYTARQAGRPWVFMIALGAVIIWILTGPIFNFSDTWQLVINTGTTIVTFLMVFLIQNSQNRDAAAVQVKLDELIRVSKAHNSFVGLERLTADELEEIRARCEERAKAEIRTEVQSKAANRKPKSRAVAPASQIKS